MHLQPFTWENSHQLPKFPDIIHYQTHTKPVFMPSCIGSIPNLAFQFGNTVYNSTLQPTTQTMIPNKINPDKDLTNNPFRTKLLA